MSKRLRTVSEVESISGFSLLYFTQDEKCVPCMAFKPWWDRLVGRIGGQIATNDTLLDNDDESSFELFRHFNSKSTPRVILLLDGKFVADINIAPPDVMQRSIKVFIRSTVDSLGLSEEPTI